MYFNGPSANHVLTERALPIGKDSSSRTPICKNLANSLRSGEADCTIVSVAFRSGRMITARDATTCVGWAIYPWCAPESRQVRAITEGITSPRPTKSCARRRTRSCFSRIAPSVMEFSSWLLSAPQSRQPQLALERLPSSDFAPDSNFCKNAEYRWKRDHLLPPDAASVVTPTYRTSQVHGR
jgi:hypothetical protein